MLIWAPVWLVLVAVVFLAFGRLFEELAVRLPEDIDGILSISVIGIGGFSIGVWLFLDERGHHNLRWYLLVAALLAGAVVGTGEGKDASSLAEAQSTGVFRDFGF